MKKRTQSLTATGLSLMVSTPSHQDALSQIRPAAIASLSSVPVLTPDTSFVRLVLDVLHK